MTQLKTLNESTAGHFQTVKQVLDNPAVHYFTENIIMEALNEHDIIDSYHDVRLALAAVEHRVRELEVDNKAMPGHVAC